MSIKYILPAIETPGISAGEKLILIIIANHADASGKAWPTLELISEQAGLGVKAVSKYIKSLAASGYLSVKRRPNSPSIYLLSDIITTGPEQSKRPIRNGQSDRSGTVKTTDPDRSNSRAETDELTDPHLKEPVNEPVIKKVLTDSELNQMITRIYDAHPRRYKINDSLLEIGKAIKRGHSPDFLLQRTEQYREITRQWPANRQLSIVGSIMFYANNRFLDDPATWVHGEIQSTRPDRSGPPSWMNDPNHSAT